MSRSLVIADGNGYFFGAKVSTSHVNGKAEYKEMVWDEGEGALEVSQAIESKLPKNSGEVILETALFGIKEINQSILIRDYNWLQTKEEILAVPYFAIFGSRYGQWSSKIFDLVGEFEPIARFVSKRLGKLQAKLLFFTGMHHYRPHGQNLVVIFKKKNGKWKPFKIKLRDLSDMRMQEDFARFRGFGKIFDSWEGFYLGFTGKAFVVSGRMFYVPRDFQLHNMKHFDNLEENQVQLLFTNFTSEFKRLSKFNLEPTNMTQIGSHRFLDRYEDQTFFTIPPELKEMLGCGNALKVAE